MRLQTVDSSVRVRCFMGEALNTELGRVHARMEQQRAVPFYVGKISSIVLFSRIALPSWKATSASHFVGTACLFWSQRGPFIGWSGPACEFGWDACGVPRFSILPRVDKNRTHTWRRPPKTKRNVYMWRPVSVCVASRWPGLFLHVCVRMFHCMVD